MITLLSLAYFPPVQYFTKIFSAEKAFIEIHDHYTKQSYRNRCHIYSPNGLQALSIPIAKNHGQKTKVKDIQISYAQNWHTNHLRSMEAAYRSSPYYEFYIPEIQLILKKKHKFLLDLNQEILNFTMETLALKCKIIFTTSFHKNEEQDMLDLRDKIHPKMNYQAWDTIFQPKKYYQVFEEKYGFIPNLSIIDLIFNEGPNAQQILQTSIS